MADQTDLTPTGDATLYQYDYAGYVAGSPNTYPAADGRSHLHVGDTNNNRGVQRGLIRFDFSTIPGAAVVTDIGLTMTVADVPNRVLQRNINFWIVAMEDLADDWTDGPGIEQSPAVPGDTTWFHSEYDPADHGELENTTDHPFLDFAAGGPGYWPEPGYFGQDELAATASGEGTGGPFDDAFALVFPGGTTTGGQLDWSNQRMVDDVQAWVDGSKDNYGWILIGEEWITSAQQVIRPDNGKPANASSKIDFFSSESAATYYDPPVLRVTYIVVPEPSSAVSLLVGSLLFSSCCHSRRLQASWGSLGDMQ